MTYLTPWFLMKDLGFTFDIYKGADGIPVIHVETPEEWDNSEGPQCRVYLNNDPIWENPEYGKLSQLGPATRETDY